MTSKLTHEKIRDVISESTVLKGKSFEIYLQGSYKNSTNIRGDSDVDIVVQLNSTFYRDLSNLSENEKQTYTSQHSSATYEWKDFKSDLITVLENYFGKSYVKVGNKSIKILPSNGRLPADVVPCAQYRRYKRYTGVSNKSDYVEGICFWTSTENRFVVNYPKVHYDNGVSKNQITDQMYKHMIRIFKNARTYMDNRDLFDKSLAPGYFIEGLLYNVTNNNFKNTYNQSMFEILNWLHKADFDAFVCQNEQTMLFGPSPEQWNPENAQKFLTSMIKLWNDWGK
ncbi:nucleotidyltransferase domain-containing protein [Paenibacillus assamensis]|uniref:nucleotidyltransferase domain-containing protein n=1 Tax=Paenibacillus assamensis TaxID=311244 RepID=UPI00042341D2|nr:nucleotidyltransferase [Paenibacillus assamensis]